MSRISRAEFLTGLGSAALASQSPASGATDLYPSTPLRAKIVVLGQFTSDCGGIGLTPDSLGNCVIVRESTDPQRCRPMLQQIEPFRHETVALWRYKDSRYEQFTAVGAQAVVGADGTAMALGDRGYVGISESGHVATIAPFNEGFTPQALATDASGVIFSLETRGDEYVAVCLSAGATFRLPGLIAPALFASSDGAAHIFASTKNKVAFLRLSPSGFLRLEYPVSPYCARPYDFALCADGTLWIGNIGGVMRIDRAGKVVERIDNVSHFITITSVCSGNSSNLFIATDGALWFRCGGRTYRLAPDRKLQYLDMQHGDVAMASNGAVLVKRFREILRVQPI